jgi:molybdopterin converting factor small subunit
LFAAARQAAGRDWVDLQLPAGTTAGQLRRRLVEELPALAALAEHLLLAVDRQYARDVDEISPDAEVACIPPVSGG